MPSRISGIGLAGIQQKVARAARPRLRRGRRRAAGRRLLPTRRGGEPHAFEGTLIHLLQTAVDADSYATYRRYPSGPRKLPPINLRDLLDFKPTARPIAVDEVESITEIRKRLVTPGMSLGALGPEAHETLSIAMNRIGAKSDSRRGRRGSGALQAARQRRQRRLGDQADRLGPLRRHRRISEQLPRDRDQDRAGRQARRGRPAARLQGDRDDRAAAPFDARRHADLAAAASRHLLDRGSGAAHLRPEADQSRRAGLREAGGALGHRHDRGRRRQGEGRRDPDLRPCRRHRRQPADLDQVCRHALGDGPVRGPPGADAEPAARTACGCAPTAASRPAATS